MEPGSLLSRNEMSGESIRQRDKRPHQRAKDKRLLDETKVNDTRDMEKDRLGVSQKGNEQNSSQLPMMGSQIRVQPLRNRENMCRWKFHMSSMCPRCKATDEDKQHILTCPAPEVRSLWEKQLKVIDLWLWDEGTDTQLRDHLMMYLRSWPLAPATSPMSPPFVEDQADIGHQYMMDRWLSQEWRAHQEQTWTQIHSQKLSKRWTSELIKKLWNVAWDMWEQRNEVLHNSDTNHGLILETTVNDQIRQIYAIGLGQLACRDFGLMKNSVDQQLQLPLQAKRLWAESIAVTIHRQQLQEHGAMVGEQWLMET